MMGDGTFALGDSFPPLPWHLRVNFDTEDHYSTSVLIHPRRKEGLRVLERCYKERIVNQRSMKGRHMERQ